LSLTAVFLPTLNKNCPPKPFESRAPFNTMQDVVTQKNCPWAVLDFRNKNKGPRVFRSPC